MTLRLVLGDWDTCKSDAQDIRYEVFVVEQGVPVEMEWDEMDAVCLHAVAYDGSDRAIATGRLLPDGHIGRMAVLKDFRGRGVGRALLRSLIQSAAKRGDREVLLSAQVHALGFYRAEGFVEEGPVYEEAGIPHQAMRLGVRS